MSEKPQLSGSAQERVDADLNRRIHLGISVYLAAWMVIAYGNGIHKISPLFVHGITIVFAIVAAVRYFVDAKNQSIRNNNRKVWITSIYLGSLVPCIVWGLLSAYSFIAPTLEPIQLFMLIAAAGIGTGSASTFAPDRLLSNLYLAGLVVPVAAVNLFSPQGNIIWGLLILIYLVFTVSLARRQSREYWAAFKNEIKLQEQHALLEMLNQRDSLTGLYNRGYFDEIIEKEWARARREQSFLSLLVIDIDYFKKINDEYGHLVGDICLKQIAKTISNTASRCTDVVTRYGGEEFAVLIPSTEIDKSTELAEKIRAAVSSENVTHEDSSFSVTISIGVSSQIPPIDQNSSKLFEAADKALYQAKQSGRNQVATG